jgi:hypothetical protein
MIHSDFLMVNIYSFLLWLMGMGREKVELITNL